MLCPLFGSQTPHLRKELQVSEFQALVLLQFNYEQNEPITYASIAEATAIEETELKRILLSLAAGKGQRVLLKQPAVRAHPLTPIANNTQPFFSSFNFACVYVYL